MPKASARTVISYTPVAEWLYWKLQFSYARIHKGTAFAGSTATARNDSADRAARSVAVSTVSFGKNESDRCLRGDVYEHATADDATGEGREAAGSRCRATRDSSDRPLERREFRGSAPSRYGCGWRKRGLASSSLRRGS